MDEPYPIVFPFHAMARSGNYNGLKSMLQQAGASHTGPIVNQADNHGLTPLHAAVAEGHVKVVRLLLESGADPAKPVDDDDGFPPLYLATLASQTDVVVCLMEAGVDANQHSRVGFVALHEAARLGDVSIAEALLQSGAICDAAGPDGSTPLCWAVLHNHIEVARMLLEHGAAPNTAGIAGVFPPDSEVRMTPVYAAAVHDNADLVDLLLTHGADPEHPNARGPGGHTCMHEAARAGSLQMINLLLASGMDTMIEAKDGTTALDWADQMEHTRIASLLRKLP